MPDINFNGFSGAKLYEQQISCLHVVINNIIIFLRNLSCQSSYFWWKLWGLFFPRFPGWKWKICTDYRLHEQLQTSRVFWKYRQLIRSTWMMETMVLPELSRTMAYTMRITVNRLVRKELHLNPVVLEQPKGRINLYIELQKHKLDQIVQEKHKNFSRQVYSFL